jgi:hypothetical protein
MFTGGRLCQPARLSPFGGEYECYLAAILRAAPVKRKPRRLVCSFSVPRYHQALRQWTNRDEMIAAVAYALQKLRPLLRRIVNEKHPDPESPIDPATEAAERIVEHLERSRYEVREPAEKPRGHRTP